MDTTTRDVSAASHLLWTNMLEVACGLDLIFHRDIIDAEGQQAFQKTSYESPRDNIGTYLGQAQAPFPCSTALKAKVSMPWVR